MLRMKLSASLIFALLTAELALASDWLLDSSQWGRKNLFVQQTLGGSIESIINENDNLERLDTYDSRDRIRKLSRPVGRLDIRFQNGKFTTCTAALVSDDTILTNFHCIPNKLDTIRLNGPVVKARLLMNYYSQTNTKETISYDVITEPVFTREDLDFSYLKVNGKPGLKWGVVSLRETPPRPAEALLVVHHPGGQPKHVTRGKCRAAFPNATDPKEIELFHTCDTLPGSSGAPVFSDNDGTMIGIHRAGAVFRGPGAKNYGVLAAALKRGSSFTKGSFKSEGIEETARASSVELVSTNHSFEPSSIKILNENCSVYTATAGQNFCSNKWEGKRCPALAKMKYDFQCKKGNVCTYKNEVEARFNCIIENLPLPDGTKSCRKWSLDKDVFEYTLPFNQINNIDVETKREGDHIFYSAEFSCKIGKCISSNGHRWKDFHIWFNEPSCAEHFAETFR